jgi:predicted RNase H-like nuclease
MRADDSRRGNPTRSGDAAAGQAEPVPTVGVDLAWGRRATTGLCLAEGGALVDSALVRTDDEIVDWIAARAGGGCVVGFDAPVILRNPTGARPCERALSRCFRAREAGCHPTNTALTAPRAAELAGRLGLSLDPADAYAPAPRAAIEVYPHAALVALFGLGRSLKYKAKTGRGPSDRHGEFARLVACLRGLAEAEPSLDVAAAPRWRELAATATASPVGAELDRAEDELDAVVCSYAVMHLRAHGMARNRIVGDAATGAIATPVTPSLAECLDVAGPSAATAHPVPARRPAAVGELAQS